MGTEKTVADIMSTRVIFLREEDNLAKISEGMDRYNFRHLPVLSDDKLVGLVSHRDLLSIAVSSLYAKTPQGQVRQEQLFEQTFVAEVMTPNPTAVGPETTVVDAARILIDQRFGCLPVVEGDNNLVGIVTEQDFLKLLVSELES
jgi:CBS domain-containing membrane protein